jgi:hypothetical protein
VSYQINTLKPIYIYIYIYTYIIAPALTISNTSFLIYGFRIILRINSDYFLKQRQPVDIFKGEVWCFLCGTDRIHIHNLDELCVFEPRSLERSWNWEITLLIRKCHGVILKG